MALGACRFQRFVALVDRQAALDDDAARAYKLLIFHAAVLAQLGTLLTQPFYLGDQVFPVGIG